MKIAIYGRPLGRHSSKVLQQLIDSLNLLNINWIIYKEYFESLRSGLTEIESPAFFTKSPELEDVDFIISIGGDGTLLDTVGLVGNSGIPVVGLNAGRLGFLASISSDHIHEAISGISKGHYSIDHRTLLRLESNSNIFGEQNFALNELTIHKKETSSMITIHTYLNGEYLNSYWADGLIIATPTGSTGYSLSCAGPIIVPQSENFVITPIAPHNLNVRPIVVSDKNVISLEVEGRSEHFMASLDSRSFTIDSTVQMAVRKEDFLFNLVRLNNQDYLSTLRKKLMWGMDSRN